MKFFVILAFFISTAWANQSLTLIKSVEETFLRITRAATDSQLSSGAWQGVIEADPSVDLMPLILAKNMGLKHPDLESQTLERIYSRQNTTTGLWSEYPNGPANIDVTASILLALDYLELSNDSRLTRAREWFNSYKNNHRVMNPGNRLIGVMGKWLPKKDFPFIPTKIMAAPKYSPVNIHSIGFTRMAVIPYAVWGFYSKLNHKKRSARVLDDERIRSKGSLLSSAGNIKSDSEFWAQEGLGWILDHQQKDGTWGGALQMTYFTMLALHEAQTAGVADFSQQIEKAWNGLMNWRAKIPEGSVIQQSTVGPVMDTARILSAIHSAPKDLGLIALPLENRTNAVSWLLKQQINTPGDWSALSPDVSPGGWTFEYFNDFNPDCDDTAMALEGLVKSDLSEFPNAKTSIQKGTQWLTGMQNKDGGFPAWDRNTTPWIRRGLKLIGAPEISDDSQVDITSRSIKALSSVSKKYGDSKLITSSIMRACNYLEKVKRKTDDGPLPLWRGEWMTNYLYGTSEAVGALIESGCWDENQAKPFVELLIKKQQKNGGWGEDQESYIQKTYVEGKPTLSQTEWVLNFLIEYERLRISKSSKNKSVNPEIEKGIQYLLNEIGLQSKPFETEFTGTFVRGVWYARYVSLAHYEAIRVLGNYLSLANP